MSSVKSITVGELKTLLDSQRPVQLIDVREEDEYAIARIPRAKLIPLSSFSKRALQEIKPDETILIYCHHGGRSMQACLWLAKQGYLDLTNVQGGIDQWSVLVDPKVPRY